jgi:hypothetical protein
MKASQSVTMLKFLGNDENTENEFVSRVNGLLFQMVNAEMSDFLKRKTTKKLTQNVRFDFGDIFNQFFEVSGEKSMPI